VTRLHVNKAVASPFADHEKRWSAHHSTTPPVVGGFLGDDHVVHVALAQTRARDPHEARIPLQLADIPRAAISHGGAQPAHKLIHHLESGPLAARAFDASATSLEFGSCE